jgi:hypothetical protein
LIAVGGALVVALLGPSAAQARVTTEAFTGVTFTPCGGGEAIFVTGIVRRHSKDAGNGFGDGFDMYKLSGVGVTTGATYKVTYKVNSVINFKEDNGFLQKWNVRFVIKGGGTTYTLSDVLFLRVVDGAIVDDRHEVEDNCR